MTDLNNHSWGEKMSDSFQSVCWTSASLQSIENNDKFRLKFYSIRTKSNFFPRFTTHHLKLVGKIPFKDILAEKKVIDIDLINFFKAQGEMNTLYRLNKDEFEKVLTRINTIKTAAIEKVNNDSLISEYKKEVDNLEKVKAIFKEWFDKNKFMIPNDFESGSLADIKYRALYSNVKQPKESKKKTSISDYSKLIIRISKNQNYQVEVSILLEGKKVKTEEFRITKSPAAFLLFLAFERKNKEKDWLTYPKSHINSLKKICEDLEYPGYILDEIDDENYQNISWFTDFKNSTRKTIVHKINSVVQQTEKNDYKLIRRYPKVEPSKPGNYRLADNIETIVIEKNGFKR